MGGSQSTPKQTFWQRIETAWGCANWFVPSNIPTCFGNLSITEKAEFLFTVLYVGGGLAAVIIIVGDLVIGGEGFVEDITSLFGDLSGIFEWLSSFLESAFGYLLAAGAFGVNEFLNLANSLAQSTGTPSLLWILVGLAAIVWAGSYVIKEITAEAKAFEGTTAYSVFEVLNTPIRWIVEGLDSGLGSWAGTIAQVFAFPINCVIFLLSEALGLIWDAIVDFF
jgi:hypothetical protein